MPNKNNVEIKSPLKWAGGKRNFKDIINAAADTLEEPFTYFEPFFGGGTIFFSLYEKEYIKKAHLNDIVPQVVNFYKTISNKDALDEVIKESKKIEKRFNKLIDNEKERAEEYYNLRNLFNNQWRYHHKRIFEHSIPTKANIRLASNFLALNKLGFNGMFRVNQKTGRFNIPVGTHAKKQLLDENNIKRVSKALQGVEFTCSDYKNISPFVGEEPDSKNLIFLDPPYIPNSKTSNFTDYSVEGFNKEAHKTLGSMFSELINKKGTNVILTNNYNKESLELFVNKNYGNKRLRAYKVDVMKSISANSASRGKTKELLVSTFPIDHKELKEIKYK